MYTCIMALLSSNASHGRISFIKLPSVVVYQLGQRQSCGKTKKKNWTVQVRLYQGNTSVALVRANICSVF